MVSATCQTPVKVTGRNKDGLIKSVQPNPYLMLVYRLLLASENESPGWVWQREEGQLEFQAVGN